jgi:hypothetical protein
MRFDYLFSYWIFVWYLLYFFHFTIYNPKFVLICAIIENLILLCSMIYYNTYLSVIILFICGLFIIKILPLYLIWNTKIKWQDILFTFFLFFIYIIWLYINNKSLYYIYNDTKKVIFNTKYFPLTELFIKLYNYFYKNK